MSIEAAEAKSPAKGSVFTTGLALFSMFFGAGNLVFPLVIGKNAGSEHVFAILGLSISAVLFPFLGLVAMMMYGGSLKLFLERLGKWPAFIGMFILFMSQGPMGAMPRLITLMHASVKPYFPTIGLCEFSVCMAAIVFWMAIRPGRVIQLVGKILTPFLLGTLALLVAAGLLTQDAPLVVADGSMHHFCAGFKGGYQTLDLTAALLFVGMIMPYLSQGTISSKQIQMRTVKASLLAASLLMLSYIGFAWLSAHHAKSLNSGIEDADLLYALAAKVLGPGGSIIATGAVFLACLTTAISLASVFSNYLLEEWFCNKVSLPIPLALTLLITACMATLGFSGIARILNPVLEILYPSIIVLCLMNMAHKIYGIQLLKGPVFGIFAIGALGYVMQRL